MLELAVYLVIGSLAGSQITETIHHGSIFSGLRALARRWRDGSNWILSKAGELVECPFCLSHWACAFSVLWLWFTAFGSAWQSPIVIFATIRLAQLLNDTTHGFTRSPPSDEELDEIIDEELDETFVEPGEVE